MGKTYQQREGQIAKYLATPPTIPDGDGSALMVDQNGNLKVSLVGGGGGGTIQNSPGWVFPYPINKPNLGGNATLDANGEKHAKVLHIPQDGTIKALGFTTESYTASGTVDVRLETVDAATGEPTGTLVAANANGSVVVNAANSYFEATLTTPVAVNRGDVVAVVIVNDATGNFQVKAPNPENDASFPYSLLYTTSWSKSQTQSSIALKYSDDSYPYLDAAMTFHSEGAYTYNNTSTPDEIGIKFTLPHDVRVSSFLGQGVFNANYDIVLYDADDNVLATVSHDSDLIASGATDRHNYLTFPEDPLTLTKNEVYRLVYKPTTTTSIQARYLQFANTAMKSVMGLQNVSKTERTDGGAWTDTDTEVIQIAIVANGFVG